MTIIEDKAFIGSNTNLVAPVRVGQNATIGAGSTIAHDVPRYSGRGTRSAKEFKNVLIRTTSKY